MDMYAIARQRVAEHTESCLAAIVANAEAANRRRKDKEKSPERKSAHERYAKSEAGRESSRRRTARYLAKPEKKAAKAEYRKKWYAENCEREREKTRAWRKAHPGYNTQKSRERRAKLKANDPEGYQAMLKKERQYHKKRRKAVPEKIRAYQAVWLAKFKEEHGISYSTYRYRVNHGIMEEYGDEAKNA